MRIPSLSPHQSKKKLFTSFIIILLVLSSGLYIVVRQSYAVTRTWDGEGTEGSCPGNADGWSCAQNWSADTVPTASDIATFDNTSDKDATIDAGFAGSVAGVDINSGYDGTITAARSLTVGSSNFDQASGTWAGGSQTLDINDGSFTVSGGSHTGTTGTWTVERSFTSSGGTLTMTGATVTLDGTGSDSSTISCTGSLGGTLNISKTGGNQTVTIGGGCTVDTDSISLQGNLTVTGILNHNGTTWNMDAAVNDGNITNNGTITYDGTSITTQGDVNQNGTWDLTGKTITFDGSSSNHGPGITCSGMLGGSVVLTNSTGSSFTLGSGCTIDVTTFNNTGDITVNGTMNVSASTMTVNSTINDDFIINSGGTVNYTGGTVITLETDFNLDPGGVFDLTGKTINVDGDSSNENQTITCTGALGGTWNLSNASAAAFTLVNGCTINVDTIDNGGDITINGTMHVSGTFNAGASLATDFVVGATGVVTYSGTNLNMAARYTLSPGGIFDLTGKTVTVDSFTSNQPQVITCSEILTGTWNFVNSAGSDLTIGSGCTVYSSSVDTSDNPNNDITINGTLIVNGSTFSVGGNLTINSSGILTYTGSSINIGKALTISGTFNLSSATLTFDSTSTNNLNCPSGYLNANVVVDKSVGTFTLTGDCTILGNFTRTDGTIGNPASPYTLTIVGNFSTSTTDAFGGANMTLAFGGPKPQTFTQNAGTISSPIVIDKDYYYVTLATALTLDSTGNNLTITDGELRNSSFTLTAPGTLTVNDTITQGTGNIAFGTLTVGVNGKYVNTSSGDIVVGAGGVSNSGTITLGNQNACGGTDSIAITSSSSPTQRDWTGTGIFNMFDLTVTDQAGSATITSYSSTPSNVGANWTFSGTCPGHLTPARLGSGARLQSGVRLK